MADTSANVRGIQFLLVATTCLAINDACNKYLAATLPVAEIVLLRAIISTAIVLAVLAIRKELAGVAAVLRPDIMLRSPSPTGDGRMRTNGWLSALHWRCSILVSPTPMTSIAASTCRSRRRSITGTC